MGFDLTSKKCVSEFNSWAIALLTEITGVLLAQRNIMEIWIVFLGGSSSTKFYCS